MCDDIQLNNIEKNLLLKWFEILCKDDICVRFDDLNHEIAVDKKSILNPNTSDCREVK